MNSFFLKFAALCLFLITPMHAFAKIISLPATVPYDPVRPWVNFSKEIQQLFDIYLDPPTIMSDKCKTKEPYMLLAFIYRGEVDHKFMAVYGPQDRSLSWCWINLFSFSDKLAYVGKEWDGPPWYPTIYKQVWCKREGLLKPENCAVIDHPI